MPSAEERPDATPQAGQRPVLRPAPVPDRTTGEQSPNVLPTVRASDTDRNAVAEHLRDAFADGRLEDEEFDVRMQRALSAKTRADLDGLLGDLGLPGSTTAPAPQGAPTAQPYPVEATGGGRQHKLSVAVCGGVSRKGRWRVPAETTAFAFWGGVELDLRAATLTQQVTTINVIVIMGGADVIVPPGVRVEVDGVPIMGGADEKVEDEDLPSTAPLVRVRYLAVMGGVSIRTKEPKPKGKQPKAKGRNLTHEDTHELPRDRRREMGC
jgi:hypothetical protein